MVAITSIYRGGLRCESTHGPSGATLATDAPKDNHGKGEAFSPTDLVATAYVTCILTTMGILANKLGITIDGASAHVEKQMVAAPMRRIGSLIVEVTMPSGIPAEHRPALEQAALHCPVHQTLHPDVARPITFIWR